MERAREELTTTLQHLRTLDPAEHVNDARVTAGDALKFFTTPPAPAGYVLEERVFGRGGDHELDLLLYRPARADEPRPGIVFVHGGGLRAGFPEMYATQACALAERGYVTASIDYRVFPQTHWPGSLEDVKCGIRWMRANAAELGVDPDRIGYLGGSAGGYLGALATMTPDGMFEGTGGWDGVSSRVAASVLIYPLTDLLWPGLSSEVRQLLLDFVGKDDEGLFREASPVTYLGNPMPPTLIVTGTHDNIVPVAKVEEFKRRLDELGADSELVIFPERGHAFDYAQADWDATMDLVSQFFGRHLGAQAAV